MKDTDKLATSEGQAIMVAGVEIPGSLEIRAINGGFQRLYKFPNGRGASVVCHGFSYGGREGLLELAVLRLEGDSFSLDYSTPITGDVLGWLGDEEAEATVLQIARLPEPAEGETTEAARLWGEDDEEED